MKILQKTAAALASGHLGPIVYAQLAESESLAEYPILINNEISRGASLFDAGRAAGLQAIDWHLAKMYFVCSADIGAPCSRQRAGVVIAEITANPLRERYHIYDIIRRRGDNDPELVPYQGGLVWPAGLASGLAFLCGWRSRELPNGLVEKRMKRGMRVFLR